MRIISGPKDIENKSFDIIGKYLNGSKIPLPERNVVRRVIHASADFHYAKDLILSKTAVKEGVKAIKKGKNIIVDASMVEAGINKKILSRFGGQVICCINDKDILDKSSKLNITRAALAMRKCSRMMNGAIIAIGNAPTALFELCLLIESKKAHPALLIGIPVGFVGAKEAKRELRKLNVAYITNRSRKGGSSVAAAIVNALLKIAQEK